MGDDPNHRGNSRRWIVHGGRELACARLQTDHIDLYQIHRPDPTTDVDETLSALTDLVRSGKVRAIGSSTFPASEIVEAQWVAERRGLERFRTEQPPYSILDRGIEREVLPVCRSATAWARSSGARSPAACSPASYRKGQEHAEHRAVATGMPGHFRDERKLDAVEQLDRARRRGRRCR